MSTLNMIMAGFGGQGILFSGKVAAYAGLLDNKQLSWLPAYGPEMRGGTCNCSVVVSDELIGSPLVVDPDVLIAMNEPSLDKFINSVVPGGIVLVDSTMVDKKVERKDIRVFYIPASKLAEENELPGLANMILLGKLYKETKFCSEAALDGAILKCVPAKKANMIEMNRKALKIGWEI